MSKATLLLIREQAKNLSDLVKNSCEYIEFMAAKKKLDGDIEGKRVLRELRKEELGIHFANIAGEDVYQKRHFVNEMYMALSLNPVISDYLNAEYNLSKIVKELDTHFGGIMDFESGSDEELDFGNSLEYPQEAPSYIS